MISGANTGFMLLAAALVMIMTPGLAFFYGGLVGRSNTLTIMIQSFASMGITTVMWWLVGYSLCFSGGKNGNVNGRDEAVAVTVQGFDKTRIVAVVPKRFAQLLDAAVQTVVEIDKCISGPEFLA